MEVLGLYHQIINLKLHTPRPAVKGGKEEEAGETVMDIILKVKCARIGFVHAKSTQPYKL